jgi:6,7-dimethyl-8-ribityllumazine synthase
MLAFAKSQIEFWDSDLVEEVSVAGSFEIPLAVKRLLKRKDVDGVVALGFIERGETLHGEAIGNAVANGVIELSLEYGKPVGFGVIGPGATHEQAKARTEKVAKEAVNAVVNMLTSKK